MRVPQLLVALVAVAAVVTAEDSSSSNNNIRGGAATAQDETADDRELLGAAFSRSSIKQEGFKPRQAETGTCNECSDAMVGTRSTNDRDDIFNQLSVREYESVVSFVLNEGLADRTIEWVSDWNEALNSNYFVFAQFYDPPKLEALAYLDGLTETKPDRYAIATIHRGKASPRDVMVRCFCSWCDCV